MTEDLRAEILKRIRDAANEAFILIEKETDLDEQITHYFLSVTDAFNNYQPIELTVKTDGQLKALAKKIHQEFVDTFPHIEIKIQTLEYKIEALYGR